MHICLEKTIFWVGAGISVDYPSCLPKGLELTQTCMKKCIGSKATEIFLKDWKSLINSLDNSLGNNMPVCPRLEVVLGCIDDIDNEIANLKGKTKEAFLAGFKGLCNFKPNINHILLNYFAEKYNSVIITSNFDTGISNASGIFENQKATVYSDKVVDNVHILQNENGIKMYHYHGVGKEERDLGATIKNIKGGVSKTFGGFITDLLKKDYNLIMLGYSMGDYFDITPFFRSLYDKKEEFKGTGIYLEHSKGTMTVSEKIDETSDWSVALNCFKTKKHIKCETTEFLSKLLKPDERERFKLLREDTLKETFVSQWEDSFKNNYDKLYSALVLIKLCSAHGIRITKSMAQGLGYKDTNALCSEMYSFLIEIDHSKGLCEYLLEYYNSDYNQSVIMDILGLLITNNKYLEWAIKKRNAIYNTVNGEFHRIAACKEQRSILKYLENICEKKKLYNSFAVYGLILKIEHIISEDCKVENEADRILKCLKEMLSRPYNEYRYISYYIMLCRYYNYFIAFRSNKKTNIYNWEKMMRISVEICSSNEIVYNLRHRASIHMLNYCKTDGSSCRNELIEAIKWQKGVIRCYKRTGNLKKARRSRALLLIYILMIFVGKITFNMAKRIIFKTMPRFNFELDNVDVEKISGTSEYKHFVDKRLEHINKNL